MVVHIGEFFFVPRTILGFSRDSGSFQGNVGIMKNNFGSFKIRGATLGYFKRSRYHFGQCKGNVRWSGQIDVRWAILGN